MKSCHQMTFDLPLEAIMEKDHKKLPWDIFLIYSITMKNRIFVTTQIDLVK